ncbi:hypothetical protein [Streptomyces sp. NPDC001282]|uniref:hypothetical protein n=1 Tax=Streptomyces sp. NPDC001282 TaxID=3364557 RepID=UPI0036748C61
MTGQRVDVALVAGDQEIEELRERPALLWTVLCASRLALDVVSFGVIARWSVHDGLG